MRFKAFFIYIAVGAAFLAASLWVFLSNGKSARAIRTKYKLGGALLTAWALLSANTCSGPGPLVTCYEPVPPEQPMCYDVAVMVNDVYLASSVITRGEKFPISISQPVAGSFAAVILDAEGNQLQKASLEREEDAQEWDFFFKAAEDLPVGKATLIVQAINPDSETGADVVEVIFRNDDITIQ